MSRDYSLYLEDILEAIRKIETYVRGVSIDQFVASDLLRDATLHNLQIVGEAAKLISKDMRARSPGIEWRKIAGLRDIVAHEYFGIDMNIVWDVIQDDLPRLRAAVDTLLQQAP